MLSKSYPFNYAVYVLMALVSFVEFIHSTSWIGLRVSTLASFDRALDERMQASAVNR